MRRDEGYRPCLAARAIEYGMPRFTRRRFVTGSAALTAAQLGCGSDSSSEAAPPAELEKPISQQGNGLNLIFICVDTWGADFLGCYGSDYYQTPSVDRLASQSAVFTDCHPEMLPTIPARRVIYTGRRVFPARHIEQPGDNVSTAGWHQLYAEDITLAEMLTAAGYTAGLVSDLYHTFKPGRNFHRGFESWRWIRGQEADRYESGPKSEIDMALYTHASQEPSGGVRQYMLNRLGWKREEDWLPARVFQDAMTWLDRNTGEQPFYLHIESFAPHEYWDPFDDYYRLYMKKNYSGPRLVSPPGTRENLSAIEFEHVRALYAGYVTMVDAWIGKFMDKVGQMGLLNNSVIVFVGDHGTMMGEQGQIHKRANRMRRQVNRVPLLVRDPREPHNGKRVAGFVQHTDIAPSLLELLALKAPNRVTGESFVKLMNGAASGGLRDHVVTGWGKYGAVRSAEWLYLARYDEPSPSFEELYDLNNDPSELSNVIDSHRSVADEYRRKMEDYIESGRDITGGAFHWDVS